MIIINVKIKERERDRSSTKNEACSRHSTQVSRKEIIDNSMISSERLHNGSD